MPDRKEDSRFEIPMGARKYGEMFFFIEKSSRVN
jgi:hypothetical protein